MAETISMWDYIVSLFIGWGIFAVWVIVVALVVNILRKKHETR